jgi:cation transport ATPase
MFEEKKKKIGMFSKMESREDALKMIKDSSKAFFFVAVLMVVLGYFIEPGLFFDAVLYAVLAGAMLKWNSRIAAVLLLIVIGVSFYSTILNLMGQESGGGTNIVLTILLLVAAIRSVEATFKVNGKYAEEDI